jgi:hypothetical protein
MIEQTPAMSGQTNRSQYLARGLWAVAVISIIGAGLLLWSHQGEAVFASMVSAAIAWCF